MKVVILAGGFGTRLSEETALRPKPMVEIGGKPILWHIMNTYAHYGYKEFVIALGYKGDIIKDYFLNFYALNSDLTIDLASGNATVHDSRKPDWTVHLVDTGLDTQTGGRIKQLGRWIGDETFMMTYGDGVADVDIQRLVDIHREHGRLATVTAVRPPSRFGGLAVDQYMVTRFTEKPQTGEGWINGGYFVLEPQVLSYIDDHSTPWEGPPVERIAADGHLIAYKHEGFWMPMDTMRDKQLLEMMWQNGTAPWAVWREHDIEQQQLLLAG